MRLPFGQTKEPTTERALEDLRRSLTRNGGPLVCGPFLGEPGFETLYWVPFLRRFVPPVLDAGGEVVIISRGGVERLYSDLLGRGARYLDVLDVFTAEEFLEAERERLLADPRSKNQKRAGERDERVLAAAGFAESTPLLPSHMFSLLRRHPHAELCDWSSWPEGTPPDQREELTLLKFWFGGQMPPTQHNLEELARWIDRFGEQGPVAAIVNPHTLEADRRTDDPFDTLIERLGIPTRETSSPRTNLGDQIEMVGNCTRFAAAYGGLAYISLYTDTPLVAFYSYPKIVFSVHFWNFSTALAWRNSEGREGQLPMSLVDLTST